MLRWKGPRRCGARPADAQKSLSSFASQKRMQFPTRPQGGRGEARTPQLTQQKSNKASTTFPFWKQPGSQGMTGHRKGWCSSAQDYFSTTKLMYYSKSILFFIFFFSGNKPKALSVEGTCSTSEPHLSPSLEGLHQTPRARRGQSSI